MDDIDKAVRDFKQVLWYLGSLGFGCEGLTGRGIAELYSDNATGAYLEEKWACLKRSKTEFFWSLDNDNQRKVVENARQMYGGK